MRNTNIGHLELFSPYPPDVCASRLTAAIDNEANAFISFAAAFGSKPVRGRVSPASLRLRKRIRYRNSFQSFLSATMRPEQGGTIVFGTFGMHPFVRVFMFVWFGIVAFVGASLFFVGLQGLLTGSRDHGQNTMSILVPVVMLGFGYALIRFGRHLSRGEEQFLTDFVLKTLDGQQKQPRGDL